MDKVKIIRRLRNLKKSEIFKNLNLKSYERIIEEGKGEEGL